jgi:excisionase family DNA binding protein
MDEKLLTIGEVAQHLNLSEEAVKELVEKGHLPAYKIGGIILRFKKEQVESYCKKHNSAMMADGALPQDKSVKSNYVNRQRLWINHKDTSGPSETSSYAFIERLEDFLYYNDFYILSFILLILIVLAVFEF